MQEPVERSHDPVEDSQLLLNVVPAARSVVNIPEILFRTVSFCKRALQILVRSEYEEAERETLLAAEHGLNPFVVTGQPGIGTFPSQYTTAASDLWQGKTMFLLWLLMRRLALGLPLHCNLTKTSHSSSTNMASASSWTPRASSPIGHYHPSPPVRFGHLSTRTNLLQYLQRCSETRLSSLLQQCLSLLRASHGQTDSALTASS